MPARAFKHVSLILIVESGRIQLDKLQFCMHCSVPCVWCRRVENKEGFPAVGSSDGYYKDFEAGIVILSWQTRKPGLSEVVTSPWEAWALDAMGSMALRSLLAGFCEEDVEGRQPEQG